MAIEFIFVYGTLRKAIANNYHAILACHSHYYADGYLQGKLYEVNNYPAAIESHNPQDKVYGELYQIVDSHLVLPPLDNYEECSSQFPKPHEYCRKKLPIILADGRNVRAWVYIFNRKVVNLTRINSGNYLDYINALNTDNLSNDLRV